MIGVIPGGRSPGGGPGGRKEPGGGMPGEGSPEQREGVVCVFGNR